MSDCIVSFGESGTQVLPSHLSKQLGRPAEPNGPVIRSRHPAVTCSVFPDAVQTGRLRNGAGHVTAVFT